MAYSTPRTWVAGEYPTAAQFNANIRDNVSFLANPPACRVYRTTALTLSSGTITPVGFDAERYDPANLHSTVTNNSRITIGTDGLYRVGGTITFLTGGNAGARFAGIWINGTTKIVEAGPSATTATHSVNVSTEYKLTAGQYVELYGYIDGGANVAVNINAAISPEFWATWAGLG